MKDRESIVQADASLKKYLTEMVRFKKSLGIGIPEGYHYLGGEDYVLDRGSPFVSEPLTTEERKFVRAIIDKCAVKRWQMGFCYYNAQMLVAADDTRTLRYYEGWASGAACIPVLHGWASLNGKVIDMTWRTPNKTRREKYGDRIHGVIPDGWAYYGAPFDTESILIRLVKTKFASSFLDDVVNGFPLFQEPRIRAVAELLR